MAGWQQWLDVVLPRDCAGCGRPGFDWCHACSAELAALQPSLAPVPEDLGLVAVGGGYEGLLQSVVRAHKRRDRPALLRSVSQLFARTLAVVAAPLRAAGAWQPPVLLVPVPPSARRPERIPMLEVARLASRASPDVHAAPVLVPRRRRRPQKGLDAQQRAGNLAGAWQVDAGRLPTLGAAVPSRVTPIVIDDVTTTGASLREAAACLRSAGAAPVASVVLSHAVGYSR